MGTGPGGRGRDVEASEELRAVTHRLYQAMNDRDFDTIGNLISDEECVLSIGTDPDEWWVGREAIGEVIRERDDFYGRAAILAARVAAQAQGGEVLVSDLVLGLVAGVDRFRFGPGRETELKGLAGRHLLHPLLPTS